MSKINKFKGPLKHIEINGHKWTRILLIICIVLILIYAYLGYFHSSFYRIELIIIPLIFLLAGVITVLFTWIKSEPKKMGYPIFFSLISFILVILISQHFIHQYKPSLNVYVPEDFEGTVYLFPSKLIDTDVHISNGGIGYIPQSGEYNYLVFHGTLNITDALNEYGSGQLVYLDATHSTNKSISFTCFEVAKNRVYPRSPWNQKHAVCMDIAQFDSLVNLHIIDRSLIQIETFNLE